MLLLSTFIYLAKDKDFSFIHLPLKKQKHPFFQTKQNILQRIINPCPFLLSKVKIRTFICVRCKASVTLIWCHLLSISQHSQTPFVLLSAKDCSHAISVRLPVQITPHVILVLKHLDESFHAYNVGGSLARLVWNVSQEQPGKSNLYTVVGYTQARDVPHISPVDSCEDDIRQKSWLHRTVCFVEDIYVSKRSRHFALFETNLHIDKTGQQPNPRFLPFVGVAVLKRHALYPMEGVEWETLEGKENPPSPS